MNGTKVLINTESFKVQENESTGGFMISGLALPFGKPSRNGATYNRESVIERHKFLEDKPMLYNHNPERYPVGHTAKIWCESDGMHYRGDVDPEETDLIRKCKRGDINKVSIQAIVRPTEGEEEGDVWVQDFLELSIVPIPGFGDTNMTPEGFISIESFLKSEPFAGYKNFDDCVAKNQDKDDPEAYCASIKDKTEPEKTKGKSIKEGAKISGEGEITMDKEIEEAFGKVLKKIEDLEDKVAEQDEPAPMDVEAEITEIKARLAEIEKQLTPSEEEGDEDDEDKDKDKDKEEKVTGSKQSGVGSPGQVKENIKRSDVLDFAKEVR